MRGNRSVLFVVSMVVFFLPLIGSCDQGLLGPEELADEVLTDPENDVEGWTYIGDSGSTVTFVSDGGNPGGFRRHLEAASGINDWLVAPEKFLGDMSAYYSGVLRYDLRTNILTSPLNAADDIILIGGEITRYHHHGEPLSINI